MAESSFPSALLGAHSDLFKGGLRTHFSIRKKDQKDGEPNSSHFHLPRPTFYFASSHTI
jgi:hypothetical protein